MKKNQKDDISLGFSQDLFKQMRRYPRKEPFRERVASSFRKVAYLQ